MAETSSPPPLKRKESTVAGAAIAMSSGTMLSRLLGFVRDAVLLGLFDRTITDAFVVGFRLPNLFRRLVGEGALTVSFIPIYVESLKKDPPKAHALASSVYTALLILTSSMFLLGLIFMPTIVQYWVGSPDGGYASVPGKMELTILLSRIMLSYLVLVITYAFYMAVANSLGYFFWPALAPAIFNLAVVVFSFLPQFQVYGDQLAYGVVVGGALQMGVVLLLLTNVGALPNLRFEFGERSFRQVIVNMVPGVLGLGIFQLMTIVNTNFAARLKEGAQSYVYCADRIIELPQSLIAISLGVALLPKFSGYLADNRMDLLLKEANRTMKILLFLALPSALGMWLLATPITELLFKRGAFNEADVADTALIVSTYALLLLTSSVSKILSPGFYALKNTWLPAAVAGVCLVAHLVWGTYLVDVYGILGLALSTVLAASLNMILINIFFNLKLGPLGWLDVLWEIRKWILGLMWMAALCVWVLPQLNFWIPSKLATIVVIVASMVGYFFFAAICKAPEAEFVLRRIRKKK